MAGSLANDFMKLFQTPVATPGATTVTSTAPFERYGMFSPETPPVGGLSKLFPNGETMTKPDMLSPGLAKGLDSLTPLLIAAGLMPLTQRGTGAPPQITPGRLNPASPFPMPSEVLARLMAAQRRG